MTKQELVEFIAENADLSKAAAARALDAMVEGISKGLKKEGKVTLVGFGTFTAKKRAARTGRNPQTGEPVKIADLAKNLIRLSGYTLGVDMNIEYTGLRPGEKLYEEILTKEEGLQKTANNLIYVGQPLEFDEVHFLSELKKLLKLLRQRNQGM